MVCPRWVASAATALPILPLPMMEMCMDGQPSVIGRQSSVCPKELAVQPSHDVRAILLPHDEGHVDRRGSLRDHLDIRRPDRVEYSPSKARSIPESYAHHRHNGPAFLHPYFAQLRQVP